MLALWCIFLTAPLATNAAKLLKVPFSSKPVVALNSLTHPFNPTAPTRNEVVQVVVSVHCGNGQTFTGVNVDTGSAILWVGARKPYHPGPNTEYINATFSQDYLSGGVSGIAYRDTVTIGGVVARGQIIGAANFTQGIEEESLGLLDGILGLGPSHTNEGAISGFNTTPTFVETLVADGIIDSPLFGIFVNPLGNDGNPEGTGELTFGGFDESRIKGDITWVSQNPPFDSLVSHWDFNVSGFSFGNITLNTTPARTDSGSYFISLPFDTLFDILHAYNATFGPPDNIFSGGFIAFPRNQTSILPPLNVSIGNLTTSIPPSKYLIAQELYASFNLTVDPTMAFSWITTDGPGMFGLGQRWLEHAYSAYDMANKRIGFAQLA